MSGSERKHKRIEIKESSLADRLSDIAESTQRRSRVRDDADPYTSRFPHSYENGKIDYPNVSVLNRPLDLPSSIRKGLIVFLALAAVIGAIFLFRYFDAVVGAPAREKAEVSENLSRKVDYGLPMLVDLAGLDDEQIMAQLSATGDTLFERTPIGTDPAGGFQVVKLPTGVTVADAAAMYLTGLDHISAANASRLLNGAWDLTVTREAPANLFLRYADFSSGSIEAAIQSALSSEGLDQAPETESGVDDAGNTFAAGTIEHDGESYSWRVSVIALSEVYDIDGLPSDSLYVGIRLTDTA